jgi:hypothetical protein
MMQLSGAGCAPDRGGMNRVHVDVLPAMTGVSRFGELVRAAASAVVDVTDSRFHNDAG